MIKSFNFSFSPLPRFMPLSSQYFYPAYDISGDLRCLSATWPQLLQEPLKVEGILDLKTVHEQIRCDLPSQEEKGLSLMVKQILGKPLDKSDQLSMWDKRPLRISQIKYAALDAYCLLEVYSAIASDPASFGLPPDFQTRPVRSGQVKKPKDKQAKQGRHTKARGQMV